MIDRLNFVLTFVSALGSGLIAGFFFAFSIVVMKALAQQPPPQGIAAMQSINIAVLNPVFSQGINEGRLFDVKAHPYGTPVVQSLANLAISPLHPRTSVKLRVDRRLRSRLKALSVITRNAACSADASVDRSKTAAAANAGR